MKKRDETTGQFRKEQAPDPMTDGDSSVRLDDPEKNYRIVGKDQYTKEADREGRHRELGYVKVKDDARSSVWACSKGAQEKRVKASQQKSIDNLKPYKRKIRGEVDFVEVEKGGLPEE